MGDQKKRTAPSTGAMDLLKAAERRYILQAVGTAETVGIGQDGQRVRMEILLTRHAKAAPIDPK